MCYKPGAASLSHAELLAILIHHGTRQERHRTCKEATTEHGPPEPGRNGEAELTRHKCRSGNGQAKAVVIAAALELGRRRFGSDKFSRIKVLAMQQHPKMALPESIPARPGIMRCS